MGLVIVERCQNFLDAQQDVAVVADEAMSPCAVADTAAEVADAVAD